MNNLERLAGRGTRFVRRGQILVIVALSMIGLLAAAGLATDVGLILMRKAQFDRAVDAAALAGVPKATLTDVTTANQRGLEIIGANGIGLDPAKVAPSTQCDPGSPPLGTAYEYCGSSGPGNLPGTVDYHVEAHWTVPLAFMNVLRISSVTLTSTSQAEYYNTVDIFTSGNDQGLIQSANLELFGPNACAANGDAFTPLFLDSHSEADNDENRARMAPAGVYTFRIAVPDTYDEDGLHHLVRVELFDPQTANMELTSADGYMKLRSDISTNPRYMPTYAQNTDPSFVSTTGSKQCSSGGRGYPCLHGGALGSGKEIDPSNNFWYVRMDENRPHCSSGGSPYNKDWNGETQFQLYYYQAAASGKLTKTYLAQYTGKSDSQDSTPPISSTATKAIEAYSTALMWVTPVQTNAAKGTVTPLNEQMPAFSCTDINGTASGRCTGTAPNNTMVSSAIEPRVQVDDIPCKTAACPSESPGATFSDLSNGDFVINMDDNDIYDGDGNIIQPGGEVDGIYQDPGSGVRYLYLAVKGISGSSENNWGLWAGPSPAEDPGDSSRVAPAFVNARQTYLYMQKIAGNIVHATKGVSSFGVGHLPYNSDTDARVRFPLANIGPELAGAVMHVKTFDADAGTVPPIVFYYDTIPQLDWSACFANVAGDCTAEGSDPGDWVKKTTNHFGDPCMSAFSPSCGQWEDFDFQNPTDSDPANPIPFYGGRLMVDYKGGNNDSFGWEITVDARPVLVY